MVFRRFVLWALLFQEVPSPAEEISPRVDAVLEQAGKTGRPVLAIAGYSNCAPCKRLKQRLAGEAALRPLVTQFIPLELTIWGKPEDEWKAWRKFSGTFEKFSPQVFVVRADGKLLYAGEAPEPLAPFLQARLAQAGQALTDVQARQLETALATADALSKRGDLAGAAQQLVACNKLSSFSGPVQRAQKQLASLEEQLQAAIDEADRNVGDSVEGLQATLVLVDASKSLNRTFPKLSKSAAQKLIPHRKQPEHRETIKQAEQLQVARASARLSPKKGIDNYRRLIEKHPGTPLAEVAQLELTAIESPDQNEDPTER